MDADGKRKSIRLSALVDVLTATEPEDSRRDTLLSELAGIVAFFTKRLSNHLDELKRNVGRDFDARLLRFVDAAQFSPPSVDSVPFRNALNDDSGFVIDYRPLDDAFHEGKQAVTSLIHEGKSLDAFFSMANLLCGLYGGCILSAENLLSETNRHKKAMAVERAKSWSGLLGRIGGAKSLLDKLVADKLIDEAQAATARTIFEIGEKNFTAPHDRLHRDTLPSAYRTHLGEDLMKLFACVGFEKTRGDFTKDSAAYFASALASQFLIGLKTNTLRAVKVLPRD